MIVKSNPKENEDEDVLLKHLSIETKTNAAIEKLFSAISKLLDIHKSQKQSDADREINIDSLCDQIGAFLKYLKERDSKELPIDTTIPEAIKAQTTIFQKLVPQKIDFTPLSQLALSIERQNQQHQEILKKLSEPKPMQDNSGYESLVRESLAAINSNNEVMRQICESLKKQPEAKQEEKKPTSYTHKVTYNKFGGIEEITSKPI